MVRWKWSLKKVKTCHPLDAGGQIPNLPRIEAALQPGMQHLLQELFPGKLSTLFMTIEM